MKKLTLITFAIIILGSVAAYQAKADEQYFYTDISIGHWLDGRYKGEEPDGKLPVTFAFGRAYEDKNLTLYGEIRHRSNLDLGFPVRPFGADEYSSNGIFAGARYKYK